MLSQKEIGHTFTDLEWRRLRAFYSKHYKCGGPTAIGGKYSYLLNPTSIGTSVEVICCCKARMDITDYSLW